VRGDRSWGKLLSACIFEENYIFLSAEKGRLGGLRTIPTGTGTLGDLSLSLCLSLALLYLIWTFGVDRSVEGFSLAVFHVSNLNCKRCVSLCLAMIWL
jgi:hypothetical protein